eukprot:UC4_evm2s1573
MSFHTDEAPYFHGIILTLAIACILAWTEAGIYIFGPDIFSTSPSFVTLGSRWTEAGARDLSSDDIRWKEAISDFVEQQRSQQYIFPEGKFKGRGIVMSAGLRTYVTGAILTIRILREKHRCQLPIQLFYFGENELSMDARKYLASFKVETIDASEMVETGVDLRGYQMKAFAVKNSRFAEVLWIDSDNYPVEDPTFLFRTPLYISTGALFWRDFCQTATVNAKAWSIFGLNWEPSHPLPIPKSLNKFSLSVNPNSVCYPSATPEFETGQMVLDKRRVWLALNMISTINQNYGYFLKEIFNGDKQTFFFGFQATKTPFSLSPFLPGALGRLGSSDFERGAQINEDNPTPSEGLFCGNTMVQKDPSSGRALFLHRTLVKFTDAELYERGPNIEKRLAWNYYADHNGAWDFMSRYTRPMYPENAFILGYPQHQSCFAPSKIDKNRPVPLNLTTASESIQELERRCLKYLSELANRNFVIEMIQ